MSAVITAFLAFIAVMLTCGFVVLLVIAQQGRPQ